MRAVSLLLVSLVLGAQAADEKNPKRSRRFHRDGKALAGGSNNIQPQAADADVVDAGEFGA